VLFIHTFAANDKDVEKVKARGFKNSYTTKAGGTITSHCGKTV